MNRRSNPTIGRRQNGFTLIELGFAAILIAILTIVVVGYFRGDKADTDAKVEADVFVNVYTKVLDQKSGGSYGPASTDLGQALIIKKQIPSAYTVDGTTITNRYGGPFSATSSVSTALVETSNIPSEACVEVAKRVSASGAAQVLINGTAQPTGPIQDAVAASACSATGNGNSVTAQTPN